jgi:hypothetical protein
MATEYGMKLNLAGLSCSSPPAPSSAFSSTTSFPHSSPSLDFSRGSSFSDVSWTSDQQDDVSSFYASHGHSSDLSPASPSIHSTAPSWRECSHFTSDCSPPLHDLPYEDEYDYSQPYIKTSPHLVKSFTPPTANLDQILDRFAQEQIPWAGVLTTATPSMTSMLSKRVPCMPGLVRTYMGRALMLPEE